MRPAGASAELGDHGATGFELVKDQREGFGEFWCPVGLRPDGEVAPERFERAVVVDVDGVGGPDFFGRDDVERVVVSRLELIGAERETSEQHGSIERDCVVLTRQKRIDRRDETAETGSTGNYRRCEFEFDRKSHTAVRCCAEALACTGEADLFDNDVGTRGAAAYTLPMRILTTAIVAAWITAAAMPTVPTIGYLHVQVDRLPQCEYGVGYENPWIVELRLDDTVVARSDHAGVYLGDASLVVGLYAPQAIEGRYDIVFLRCPSLRSDPRAALLCESPEQVHSMRARLTPRGLENPERVRLFGLRETCLNGNPSVQNW